MMTSKLATLHSLIADFGLWIANCHGWLQAQSAIRNRQSAITTASPTDSPASVSGSSGTPLPSRHRSPGGRSSSRSEEHTSELQSLRHLVCRLLLEKKKK